MLPLVILAAGALAQAPAPAVQTAPSTTAAPSEIRVVDLQAHLNFLASDAMEGRGSGTRGARLAAEYIAAHWKRLGFKPANEGSYFHEFSFPVGGGESKSCRNTCAILPGTDPSVADKYIVIGAHHDHAGLGDPMMGAQGFYGEIHNGADDNGSGTTGVLELAEYFAANPLRHPIVFMTFSAEERGLLGSEAIVEDKVIDPANMLFMLNIDMIGRVRDGYLFVGGNGTATELSELTRPAFDAAQGFNFEFHPGGKAPSDNTNFYEAGVPCMFFFSHIHDDYHMPEDDVAGINFQGMKMACDLGVALLNRIDSVDSLTFVQQSNREANGMPADFMERMVNQQRHIGERRLKRGRLGLRNVEPAKGGLLVTEVSEGGGAESAGVQVGDILIYAGDRRVGTTDDLRLALAGKWKGDKVRLVVMRDIEEIDLTATLQ